MKRTREHRVPLSAEAMKLIERLPRNGEYLFTVNGNGKPIVAMSLRKALHRHGGDGFTVHGFQIGISRLGRRADQRAAGIAGSRAGARIGNATEASYARGDLLEKRRRVMQQWATHCATPSAPAGRDTVVTLRGVRRG